ncbi:MAG: hypothetical protein KF835_05370 [Xanthobacteraceae bacterium]|nr:hypothetical protein [Xanthobacteraceae bacterium]
MPEIGKDSFTCFVQGHGAQYSSSPTVQKAEKAGHLPASWTLADARKRAAEQLAFQRIAKKLPAKK